MMTHIQLFMYVVIWAIVSFLMIMFFYGLIKSLKQRIPKEFNAKFEAREEFRSSIDRRSGFDRRKIHNLDYFQKGGMERRSWKERRSNKERRKNWVRGAEWASVFVSNLR
jgi:hypothetical protein